MLLILKISIFGPQPQISHTFLRNLRIIYNFIITNHNLTKYIRFYTLTKSIKLLHIVSFISTSEENSETCIQTHDHRSSDTRYGALNHSGTHAPKQVLNCQFSFDNSYLLFVTLDNFASLDNSYKTFGSFK